jgi:hypothetical protein
MAKHTVDDGSLSNSDATMDILEITKSFDMLEVFHSQINGPYSDECRIGYAIVSFTAMQYY